MNKQFLTQAALAFVFAVTGLACASKDDGGFTTATATTPGTTVTPGALPTPITSPTPIGGGADNYFSNQPGSNAVFTPDSIGVLNQYIGGSHALYSPTNFRLNVNLYQAAANQWAGTVQIAYTDNGQLFDGTFNTGTGINQVSYQNWYVGDSDAAFNQWFSYGGKTVFHGFFQDTYGAIVLVIDNTAASTGVGEGVGGSNTLSGEVYFLNFQPAGAPQYINGYGERCWFLEWPSPYACGAFEYTNGQIFTTTSLYPANGYTRLGTFTGLNKTLAFPQ